MGLCYFPLGVGLMIGSIVSGRHSDYVLQQLKDRKEGQTILEMRLKAAIPSFFLIPAGYLIYGWTTQKAIAVYAPLIGLFVCRYTRSTCLRPVGLIISLPSLVDALGQMSAFTPTSVYLVDSKPGKPIIDSEFASLLLTWRITRFLSHSGWCKQLFSIHCRCHHKYILVKCCGWLRSWYIVHDIGGYQCGKRTLCDFMHRFWRKMAHQF